ncbi:conserved protein of unknown function [Pseudomonas marincola]|uniref:KOW domain-containing protein n=1 Tax=Pseudomonas marincola TaxID=437900 RepID=A0A653E640_9PSED|nr:preprotein translocase subunit YajC [Pseudomonas marincola]CAE6906334.1 conserved protein of unknown function [Pseudomonas marincola]
MNRPTQDFLQSLERGSRVIVDQGQNGQVTGKVSKITEKLIFVRLGKELRRFTREDGGTFQAPSPSRSWLLPVEAA